MSRKPKPIREPADKLTKKQIQRRIKELLEEGAESCTCITEDGKKFIVTQWPE